LRWNRHPYISTFYIPHPDSVGQEQAIQTASNDSWHYNSGIATPVPRSEKVIFTRSIHKKATFSDIFRKAQPERLALYQATSNGQVWFNLTPIFPLDSLDYSEAHPSLSEDGNTLYFASDMAGGFGGSDIYVSTKDATGKWSSPRNLGAKINSADNEMYPFIHEDGTLYFSSNRQGGMGGYDIYEAIWNGEEFHKVVNMGVPTNSIKDDISFIVNEPKRICYLSSNRDGGEGGFDIYKMTVKLLNISRNLTDGGDNVFGMMNIVISGQVLDSTSNQPVKRAMVKIRDFNNDDIQVAFADAKGVYKFTISNDNKFQISASRIGYNTSQDYQFSTYGITTPTPLSIDIGMKPVVYTVTLDVAVLETSNSLESNILPVVDAKLVLKDLESNKTVEHKTDKHGNHKFILEQGKSYSIVAVKDGYQASLPHTITAPKRSNSEKIELNITLTKVEQTNSKDFIIKAVVKDRDTKKGISNATVLLKNIQTKQTTEKITDENGIALFEVDTTHSYVLESVKEKYQLDNYVHILPKGMQTGVMVESILPMKAITYSAVPLDFNIPPLYYSSGKVTFDNDVMKSLDEVYELLQKYKSIKIAITGHTDNSGSREANLVLSQKRANAAQNYLLKKGLPKYRITTVTGMGDDKPAEKCDECTEEQNKKNRRTEFMIIER
jgi:outer membrane protein OmpA-like peptidoglycan-associated protein